MTDANSDMSGGAATLNLGSNFLERLGNQATWGFGTAGRSNPGGGGASEATEAPRFRTWGEAYGVSAHTGAQADFVGDHRQTWGGVAGLGVRVVPGFNVGISIDQSRTAIDIPLALQSASLNLTQIGVNASLDKGPWTWAVAAVHGFGKVNSIRDTGFGFASAGYNAEISGALTELSYYWTQDQSRIVPKAAFEYARASTGSFQEVGGFDPVMASGATAERARILLGAGADPNATAIFYGAPATTLELLVSSLHPYRARLQADLANQLLDAGADDKDVLLTALAHGYVETAEDLARRLLADTLPVAAGLGRIEVFEALLSGAPADLRHQALALAAMHGRIPVLERLLAAGADLNQLNPMGFHGHATPLHLAVWKGHEDTVRWLVAQGARCDVADVIHGGTPLGWARHEGHAGIARYLQSLTV